MKNEKIINALNELEPSEEIENEIFDNIIKKQNTKRSIFKPTKIIATAAAVMLIIGLVNIQTVIAFVSGLFFVPGVGLTSDENIIYEGLEKPIVIETDYGSLTLEFLSKVTRNGKTNLSLYIDSKDIPAKDSQDYPITLNISVSGENIVSEDWLGGGGTWDRNNTVNHVYYFYSCENFPDINEFDLALCGTETHIILTEQPNNFALSKENNGVTLAAYKFNGVNMMCIDILNKHINPDEYKYYFNDLKSKDGSYHLLNIFPSDEEIKSFKTDVLVIDYYRDSAHAEVIEIPIPKDGDTIATEIKVPIGDYIYEITEVRREGDIIYYTDNSIPRETTFFNFENGQWQGSQLIPQGDELEKAIKDRKMYIDTARIIADWDWENDWENAPKTSYMGAIWNFDENADTIRLKLTDITIRQYGDFDIIFE